MCGERASSASRISPAEPGASVSSRAFCFISSQNIEPTLANARSSRVFQKRRSESSAPPVVCGGPCTTSESRFFSVDHASVSHMRKIGNTRASWSFSIQVPAVSAAADSETRPPWA